MRSVKKLLIITLFLGMTLPLFAQDETQSASVEQSVTTQSATDQAFLGRRRPNHRHRGPGANRRHRNSKPLPNPTVPPIPPGCTFKFDPQGARAVAGGDVGMVMVTVLTGTDCPVTASSNSSFIRITGIGGQIVSFSVDPNTTNFVRSGSITISGHAYGVTQDGAFPNFDGTYNISFSIIVQYTGPCPCPPPVSQSGATSFTFVNGVLVNGGGVTSGTISDFGEVNVTTSAGGYTLQFTGSVNETGSGSGLVSGGGVPFVSIGGSWQGARQ